MGMVIWHMVPNDGDVPPPAGLALDLATCVYNSDITEIHNGISGSGASEFSADGSEAWVYVINAGAILGVDISSFIAPGGTVANNGNNLSTTGDTNTLKFSPDGTRLVVREVSVINSYTLSTPYLMSSASVTTSNSGAFVEGPVAMSWDGLTAYRLNTAGTALTKWDLSPAWDISSVAEDVGNTVTLPVASQCICVSRDETRIYASSLAGDDVREYVMSIPQDLTTIPTSLGVAVANYTLDASALATSLSSLAISYDQTHLLLSSTELTGTNIWTYTGTVVP